MFIILLNNIKKNILMFFEIENNSIVVFKIVIN